MKLKTLLVILALVAAGAFILSDFYGDRATKVSLRELESREKVSKVIYAKAIKEMIAKESQADAKIAELNGHLDSNAKYISALESDKINADKELARLRESWGGLDIACQGRLKELDNAWGKKFSLAQEEVSILKEDKRLLRLQLVEKDTIIASLHATLSAADDRIKGLEATVATITGKYIRARNTGYLKTAAVVAIAVLAVIA
jgi:chromosome segregation ATPase